MLSSFTYLKTTTLAILAVQVGVQCTQYADKLPKKNSGDTAVNM